MRVRFKCYRIFGKPHAGEERRISTKKNEDACSIIDAPAILIARTSSIIVDQARMNETAGADSGDSGIETDDALASWQIIFVALAMTCLQTLCFLVVFEVARRNESTSNVFDRRRLQWPQRVPPPLRHRLFEWWRVKVSHAEYTAGAQAEEEIRKQRGRATNKKQKDSNNRAHRDAFLQKAERLCYRESPFFDPGQEDELEGATSSSTTWTKSLPVGELADDSDDPDVCEVDADDHVSMEVVKATLRESAQKMGNGGLFTLPSAGPKPNGILRTRSVESEPVKKSNPASPSWRSKQRRISLRIGGSERSLRHVRFGSADTANADVSVRRIPRDARLGDPESLRFLQQNFDAARPTLSWDTQSVKSIGSFFKTRVLMIHDDEDEPDQSSEDPGQAPKPQDFVVEKVLRRPLNKEDAELLRLIGLDAFMTLRFVRFAVDISFWSLVLAAVTLFPMYRVAAKENDIVGFFSITVISVEDGSARFWWMVVVAFLQFSYILRRLWIEWELFLPLRYDFLENGDFQQQKYQAQYAKTCLVEYLPRSLRRDKDLYDFFDTIFPGEMKRAEVLLNTEHLRSLLHERQTHIVAYEDVYAKKVHKRAVYLREVDAVQNGGVLKTCCGAKPMPVMPPEPHITVNHMVPRSEGGFLNPQTRMVRDPKTYEALHWHHSEIQRLNKEIEDDYLRLACGKHRPVSKQRQSRLSKWLKLQYLTGTGDTGMLQSSTAFVEFTSITSKQQAIQSNLAGAYHFLEVKPVPEVRAILWPNAHLSHHLINVRRSWANVLLCLGLVAWSSLVVLIRSIDNMSSWINLNNEFLVAVFDGYVPALVVEGLVRIIPLIMRPICQHWIRFKASSEVDHYVLRWYFWFRFLTFVSVIIGGTSLADSRQDFARDPVGFLRKLSQNMAIQADFFAAYVIVTGGVQIFFRLSQIHNVGLFWIMKLLSGRREATSKRRLETANTEIKKFHFDEFIPLFLFIVMVGLVFGTIAPLCNLFVALFFKCAFKVFKYMTIFIYGGDYEGGGFLFYTVTSLLFFVLYVAQVLLAGYLSLHGTGSMAAVFAFTIVLTRTVQVAITNTFIVPSKTLSLARARVSDEKDPQSMKQAKKQYRQLRAELEEKTSEESNPTALRCRRQETDLERSISGSTAETTQLSNGTVETTTAEPTTNATPDSCDCNVDDSEARRRVGERFQQRYQEADSLSEFTDDSSITESGMIRPDFFIYRQPSLNRATWEVMPKPYR